jgi:hypothetical protein
LPEAQTKAVLDALNSGRADSVGLKLVNSTGDVRLTIGRAGRDSGYQRMSFQIAPDGTKNLIVQTAFDDAGKIVVQPGNKIYDIKKGGR